MNRAAVKRDAMARQEQTPNTPLSFDHGSRSGLKGKVSFSIVSQGLSSFLLLALTVFLARYLSKRDYGTYQQIQMIASTLGVIAVLGAPQALYYFIPKIKNVRRLVDRTIVLCLLSSICFGIGFLILGSKIAAWMNNPDLARLAYLSFFFLLGTILVGLFEPAFISIGKSNTYYGLSIVFTGMLFASVILPLFISGDIKWILTSLILQNIIASVVLFLMFRRATSGFVPLADERIVKVREQLAYGIPIALAFIVSVIGKQIDRFIISAYFSPADFAVYSRGAMEIPLIPIVVYSFSTILMPRYIALYDAGRKHDMVKLWGESIVYVALINFPMFVLLYYLADDLMVMLYSVNYQGSAQVLRGFLFLLLIQVTSMGGIIRVMGNTKIVTYLSLLTIGMNITVGVLLVPIYGVMGPVIATVASGCAATIYVLHHLRKKLEVPMKHLWPWKKMGQIFLVSLISCSVFALNLLFPVHVRIVKVGVTSVAFGACYLCLAYFSNIIPKEDVRSLVGSMKRKIVGFLG